MIRRMLSNTSTTSLHSNHTFLPITLLIFLSLPLFLLYLHPPPFLSSPRQHPIPSSDEFDDLTLFNRALSSTLRPKSSSAALTFSRIGSHNPTRKVAFLFLTNSDLFFSPLWARFFNSSDPAQYNIYIHSDPDSAVSDPGGVFSGRFIKSKHTERSSATLISAERRLIANAIIDDPMNVYFALLSQTCVPLHSFRYVYDTLFSASESEGMWWGKKRSVLKSFIEVLANETTLPSRYIARGKGVMMPEVPYEKFRVGSQFFVLNKKHALMVLRERRLWRKFRLPCFRYESCYPEEHYFPTYLDMEDPEGVTGYTVTRVNWTDSVDGHPHTYRPPEVSAELIYTLRTSNFSHDYLFARKFSPDCLPSLMDLADDVLFKD